MKIAINYRLALCLCLLSAAAERAVLASEPVLDGQEQARAMILGRPGVKSPSVVQLRHVRTQDPLESARRMILGSTPKANSGTAAANAGCDAAKGSLIAARP